ncbi:hypothetical protein [Halosegnis sp.]|uniref:hypothetical protein n=1 Tax=Halosegnis sp. TaxID=2864959 RepID=UPI0035D49806
MGARSRWLLVCLGVVGIVATAGLVAASPAPISACPPCDEGFVRAAGSHGLETDIAASTATVRVHPNHSATWTARVTPTNDSVTARLAANASLARDVATDSFGIRYGDGIPHDFQSVRVTDGTVVIRYRTADVVQRGPFGTQVLTYFRDEPGAYVYTDLGAAELTVVAPSGTTIARGFGDVDDRRLTARELPGVQNGPFVVFAPEGTPAPGLVGTIAILGTLGGVILRNLALFVVVPGTVVVGGLAAIRRVAGRVADRSPERLGAAVAVGGGLLLVWTLIVEADALPAVTGLLILGGVVGGVLLACGAAVGLPALRRHGSPWRILGIGVAVAAVPAVGAGATLPLSTVHRGILTGVVVLPAAVALGWSDAGVGDARATRRLLVACTVVIYGGFAVVAPLTDLGGSLFLLGPLLVTGAAVVAVAAAGPLYVLGVAGGRTAA